MKKEKPITSDLFEIETCVNCGGEGEIQVNDNTTEDCDICHGTGVDQ